MSYYPNLPPLPVRSPSSQGSPMRTPLSVSSQRTSQGSPMRTPLSVSSQRTLMNSNLSPRSSLSPVRTPTTLLPLAASPRPYSPSRMPPPLPTLASPVTYRVSPTPVRNRALSSPFYRNPTTMAPRSPTRTPSPLLASPSRTRLSHPPTPHLENRTHVALNLETTAARGKYLDVSKTTESGAGTKTKDELPSTAIMLGNEYPLNRAYFSDRINDSGTGLMNFLNLYYGDEEMARRHLMRIFM